MLQYCPEKSPQLAILNWVFHLDALLCAIQAAWAQTQEYNKYGLPEDADPLEGWIADPTITSNGAR